MLQHKVVFMLVGGYAVNYHGYNRTTGDMDVWLKPDNNNKLNFIDALRENGIEDSSLQNLCGLDFTDTLAFSIGENPYRTDFLTRVSGVSFEQADVEKNIADIDGLKIPFINLNHLVLSKFGTGRLQDETDIEKLQEVARRKKE